MGIQFKDSQTKVNLMKAFAGESQARNRYTFSARQAEKKGLHMIAEVFRYTAEQERAHAERFYELMRAFSGETIYMDGTFPVDRIWVAEDALIAARHNEHEEFADVYPAFAQTAKEEGFMEVCGAFLQIARIEEIHEKRFARMAEMVKGNEYFSHSEADRWICMNCGYVHEGGQAPENCPVCRYEKGYFLPIKEIPYC